ncbi:MAG: hypothetical protein ACLFTT_16085 [Candidatus Hydrogenedentota bacterium]
MACLILAATASGFAQKSRFPEKKETLYVEPEAKPLREAVLRWAESLRSFNGKYTLRQRWPHRPEAADKPPRKYTITYRFDGDNAYMERVESLEPVGKRHSYLARYEGDVIGRFDYDYPENAQEEYGEDYPGRDFSDHVVVRDNVPAPWPEPETAYLPPPELFQGGFWPQSSLAEFMQYGETRLRETDHGSMLVHRRHPAGREQVMFAFDEDNRVVTIETGLGFLASMEELETHFPDDPLGAFRPRTTYEFGGYKEIDGVHFPTWAQETVWEYASDTEEAKRRAEAYHSGTISLFELQSWIVLEQGTPFEATVLDFELLSLAQPLNTELEPADFQVPIPTGAFVNRDPTTQEVVEYVEPWYARLMKPVPLAVLAGLVLLIGGAAWYIARD